MFRPWRRGRLAVMREVLEVRPNPRPLPRREWEGTACPHLTKEISRPNYVVFIGN